MTANCGEVDRFLRMEADHERWTGQRALRLTSSLGEVGENLKSKLDHVADEKLNLDPGRFEDLGRLLRLYDREGV